jgi:succinate dehydrogenase/fumarate reductase cytochrome b subunit
MNRIFLIALSLVVFPLLTFAQPAATTVSGNGLQNFFKNLLAFINDKFIPFLIGLAFLFFIINAIRYFVIGGAEEEGRENAKNLALYSVFAFVTIIIFWGVINMLTSSLTSLGINKNVPTPDYIEKNSKPTP